MKFIVTYDICLLYQKLLAYLEKGKLLVTEIITFVVSNFGTKKSVTDCSF